MVINSKNNIKKGISILIKQIPAIFIALFVCGCGGSKNEIITDVDLSNDENQKTELEGNWTKSCNAVDPTDPETLYDIVEVTFTGDVFDSSILNYVDAGCTVPLEGSPNPTSKGNFSLGNSLITESGMTAVEFDTHITSFNGAPFEIDSFDIYYLDGNRLYFGDDNGSNDGSSESLRPKVLNFDREYLSQ